jgi:hypothetical protein
LTSIVAHRYIDCLSTDQFQKPNHSRVSAI